jgi:hypothetical protein
MGHYLPRGRIDVVALLFTGSVTAAAVLGTTPDSAGSPRSLGVTPNVRACPLTLPQEHKAWQAFDKMLPAILHPRCFNCHGGVDPFKPADEGGHLGGAVGRIDRFAKPGECRDCHYDVRNLRNGRLFEWEVPPEAFNFVGKGPRELCNQFKALSEPDPAYFVRHILNDNRSVQFTEAAYKGDRHLTAHGRDIYREATGLDMVPEPPPIPHTQFVAYAQEWADAIGFAGWKIPDCGCRIMANAWEGTVTTVLNGVGPGGSSLRETMHATARFEIDSSFIINAPTDPAIHWKTTSGVLKWTVNATGGDCFASASGTVPIRLGADDNPWGLIRMEPDASGKELIYSVGIGPWPEGYEPRYTYRCRKEVPSFPGIPYALHSWWMHPDGAKVSPDGKTIKDSLTSPHPIGTIKWVWDFKLVR